MKEHKARKMYNCKICGFIIYSGELYFRSGKQTICSVCGYAKK